MEEVEEPLEVVAVELVVAEVFKIQM